jgi:O-antigen/teichoic acid export membrane protein
MRLGKKTVLSSQMKNVAKISSGTIMGQAISIITLPIITRIYGAKVMGIWATILAISAIIHAFCDLGLSNSIMIEEDEKEISTIYRVVTRLSNIICALSGFVVFPYYIFIKRYDLFEAIILSFFMVIYTITMKQVNTCYTWLNRYKKYNVLMKNPLINYTTVALFSITLGLLGLKTYGYFLGVILGQVFTLVNMRGHLPLKDVTFGRGKIKQVCAKYRYFMKFQMPNSIMNQFRQQLPDLLIGTFFGDTLLGYYSLAMKILNIPVTNIGQALGKVFFQTISELKRQGQEIRQYVIRNLFRATKIAIVPLIMFFAFGDIAVVVFFGNEFVVTGYILRIVMFRIFFTFVSTATQGLDIVLEKQKYAMISTFVQTVSGIISVCVGYYLFDNIYVAVGLIVVSFMAAQILYFCKMISIMKSSAVMYIKKISFAFSSIIVVAYTFRIITYEVLKILGITFFDWFTIL